MKDILMITTVKSQFDLFRQTLADTFSFKLASSLDEGYQSAATHKHDYVLIDLDLLPSPVAALKEVFQNFWRHHGQAHIVVLSDQAGLARVVTAIKAGAEDYLVTPLSAPEIQATMLRIQGTQQTAMELSYLRREFWQQDAAVVQTRCPAMEAVYQAIEHVAATASTILLTGETGVGKSFFARLIHQHSKVSGGPFISLHCGAIAETLIESELFGHERGAFTGAIKRKPGRFELANGGTLFLDEISTISSAAQIKLLQVIQEGFFQRVGGEADVHTNARLISATNEDLQTLCEDGRFRFDLFYRLNVFPINIPPLRERSEDIPFLIETFLERLNRRHDKELKGVTDEALAALKQYHWPGNIRELENLLERAFILERGSLISLRSFPVSIRGEQAAVLPINASSTLAEARQAMLADFERQYIETQLKRHGGRINETARASGISERQLHRLMKKYDLDRKFFK